MGKDEYTSGGGGALKLKGTKNAGIDKKRKKEKKATKRADPEREKEGQEQRSGEDSRVGGSDEEVGGPGGREERESKALADSDVDGTSGKSQGSSAASKTEAERRHEEMRKRRLDERLKRDGVKTHKERVEELNKYLSTLSEHHDMPRIGPG